MSFKNSMKRSLALFGMASSPSNSRADVRALMDIVNEADAR